MIALLDVNVLIALVDERHSHHRRALDWLTRNVEEGWATCPITQNGCLRILCPVELLDGKVVEVEVRDVKEPVSKRNGPSENEDESIFDTNKLVNELREELGI